MKSGILSRQSLSIALAFLALSLTGVSNTVVAETPVVNEVQKLLASDKADGDAFGWSVALDGDTAVIAAWESDDSGTIGNGAAYVFTRVGGIWTGQTKLLAGDKDDFDEFGWSVALDGDTAVIGAKNSDDSGTENNGAAYVFDLSWLIRSIDIAIDVRPGNLRNVINPYSRGRFWVTALSDREFDALQVDPESVALGEGGASPDRYRVKDVNHDRLPDLMLRFRTPEVGLQCGDTEVELTGETYAGDSIVGSDSVKTVGCKKKPKKGKTK